MNLIEYCALVEPKLNNLHNQLHFIQTPPSQSRSDLKRAAASEAHTITSTTATARKTHAPHVKISLYLRVHWTTYTHFSFLLGNIICPTSFLLSIPHNPQLINDILKIHPIKWRLGMNIATAHTVWHAWSQTDRIGNHNIKGSTILYFSLLLCPSLACRVVRRKRQNVSPPDAVRHRRHISCHWFCCLCFAKAGCLQPRQLHTCVKCMWGVQVSDTNE